MQLGTNIKVVRTSRKLSQKELASKVGVTKNYLSMVENNIKTPSLRLLEKLATTLQTPISALFAERLTL